MDAESTTTSSPDLLTLTTSLSGLVSLIGHIASTFARLNDNPQNPSPLGIAAGAETKNARATIRLLQRCLERRHGNPARAGMVTVESLVVVLVDMVLCCDDMLLLTRSMEEEGAGAKGVVLFEKFKGRLGPCVRRVHGDTMVLTALTTILLSKSDKEALQSANYVHLSTQRLLTTNPLLSQKMSHMSTLFSRADDYASVLTSDTRTRIAESIMTERGEYAFLPNNESTDHLLISSDTASTFSFDDELVRSHVYQRNTPSGNNTEGDLDLQEYYSTLNPEGGMTLGDKVDLAHVPMPIATTEIREPKFYGAATMRSTEGVDGRKAWKRVVHRQPVETETPAPVPVRAPVDVQLVGMKPGFAWERRNVTRRHPFSSRE